MTFPNAAISTMPAMSPPAKPISKRKHVTTACLSCRRSKVKCDGLTPACSNCINKNNECRYQMGDDRRKLSLRVAVELLCRRVSQLCQFVEESGLQIPAMQEDEEAMLQRILTTVGVSHEKLIAGQHHASHTSKMTDGVMVASQPAGDTVVADDAQGAGFDIDLSDISRSYTSSNIQATSDSAQTIGLMPDSSGQDWESVNAQEQTCPRSQPSQLTTMDQTCYQNSVPPGRVLTGNSMSPVDDTSDNESVEELVDLLSDRMGSLQIGPDGQIRFYGPTSNYSLLDMSSTDPLHVHRSIRNDGQEYLDRLDVGAEAPAEIEEHLTSLYFAWQDAAFHVVDREMYESGKLKWHQDMQDTPYYSEALRNATCSLGAAFETKHHPNFVTFPKSLGDFFADRAKTLLDIEMDAPCLATVQAMVVTSCHDMGCTRDARAWLYSGMAIRLAFDLALHKDMTLFVEKGIITQAEANLRRTVFWGTYVVDQAWAFQLGRQFKINMDDVTCAKPDGDLDVPAGTQWTPYSSPVPTETQPPLIGYVNDVSRQRALLCEIMAPLGYKLYNNSGMTSTTLQHLNAKTVDELVQWKENLPQPLKVDVQDDTASYLPHVLLMHMHYYQCMIQVHRPWMSKTYIQPNPPQGPGSGHARQTCVDAAISISRLLQAYERSYTFRRMNSQGPLITCSAALLLIFADITQYRRSQGLSVAPYLSVCFRALEEFGQAWESAKRARDFLIRLQRQWELKARSRRNMRRTAGISKANLNASKKRPLTATDFEASQGNISVTWGQPPLQSQLRQTMPNSEQQQQGLSQGVDDGFGPDFDMDFDWITEANEQAVSGKWTSNPSSRSLPFDFMGFLSDPRSS